LDRDHDAIEVRVDVGIPEPQGAEAGPAEHRIAHGVMVGLNVLPMLAAVDLDDQAAFEADEIKVEAEERRLPAEVGAVPAHCPQLQPQARFLPREALA